MDIDTTPTLPLECIAMVIERIDNPQDLISLLTVSRDVFLIASRCLYCDPIKYFPLFIDEPKACKLISLLLSLSPAGGEDIDIIRKSIALSPSFTPINQQPMLNYLSLVKVFRWRRRNNNSDCWLPYRLQCLNMNARMHLTWAFVGHRLDEVEELEIDAKDQERYLSNIAKMTSLHKIWIFTGKKSNHYDMYDFAEAMIKAIQLHHGLHQLSECHMIPNPLTQYRPFGGVDLSPIWRVVSLLPPPRHHRTLPTPDGSIALLNQPLDPYVATIENLSNDDFRFNSTWVALMRVYPGHSDSQLLQRLRGLTSLSIPCKMANGNDDNLLAWAAYEAEHYSYIPDVYHSGLLVPLENLEIVYGHTRFGSPPPKWKILQDGLLGFSGTLKSLSVFYPQFENGTVGRVFTIPRPLLKLKSLKLRGLTIDRSVWEQAPNIEELYIDFGFPSLRESATIPNRPQSNHNTGATTLSPTSIHTTTTTAVIAEEQCQRQSLEFWFHCPKLVSLSLVNQAINLFDPCRLQLLPKLEILEMLSWSPIARRHIADDDVDPYGEREALRMLHPTHWTWDWSLPVLTRLKLNGDLHEMRFSMAILRSCPFLNELDLGHHDENHHFPLRVKGILDIPLDKGDGQILPFAHDELTYIRFHGDWDIEVDELGCLLQALPVLQRIKFGSVHFEEGFRERKLIEITRAHPELSDVTTDMVRSTESLTALGLSVKEFMFPTECGSIESVIDDKDGSKTPIGPTTYTFRSPGECIRDEFIATVKGDCTWLYHL